MNWRSDWIYGDLDEPQIFKLRTSGIDNVGNGSITAITITPTIVDDVINVRAPEVLASVNIFAGSGALVDQYKLDTDQATLSMSHLSEGVYFVEVITVGGTRAVKKVIKR